MEFVNPSFLYGLLAIAIPIIIHLFNFRKFKRIAFTNVRFLKEVKEETQSKSKIKHLLILLSRILAIAFLVLAFAQPYLPAEKSETYNKNAVSIFIDNSFSMDAEGETGRLFEVAKKYANDIAASYSNTDKFQLVTNDFEGKHRHFFNREEFLEIVVDVESSPISRNVSEIIKRQSTDLAEKENFNKVIYFLSDFQESTTDLEQLQTETGITTNFVPILSNSKNNIYIDSIWFESPVHMSNQTEKLHVKIVNASGKEQIDVPLKLVINNEQKALTSFSIGGNEYIDSTLTFTNTSAGIMNCNVEIQDYPITYDDKLFFSYKVADSIPVMYIFESDTNHAIKSVLENDPLFKLTCSRLNNLDYSLLSRQNIVILESLKQYSTGLVSELGKFSLNGKSIFIIPHKELDTESYQELALQLQIDAYSKTDTTSTKVSTINLEDDFYENVFEKIPQNIDLPIINSHFKINTKTANSVIEILALKNGDSFLNKYKRNSGAIYTLSCPINESYTNFAKHAIFLPTLYKMVLLSSGREKLYYTIGKDKSFYLPSSIQISSEIIHIKSSNKLDIIPETRKTGFQTEVFVHNQLSEAANYDILMNEKAINGLGFNYNKSESKISVYTAEALSELVQGLGLQGINIIKSAGNQIASSLKELNAGVSYWKACIILVILFFGIEILLIKFWNS